MNQMQTRRETAPTSASLSSMNPHNPKATCWRLILLIGSLATITANGGRLSLSLNPAWRFCSGSPEGSAFAVEFDDSKWDLVSLPHSQDLFGANLAGFGERDIPGISWLG
jgi:hypothetical protein